MEGLSISSLIKKLGIKGLNDLYKYIIEGYIEDIEDIERLKISIKERIKKKIVKHKYNIGYIKHKDNPNYNKQYLNNKYKTDLKYNLNHKISSGMFNCLKRNKAGRKWELLVGYNSADLVKRLNKTIPEGYTWKDFLSGELHIDHIIPISAFNFTRPEHTDFKRCWALGNLRLLPAKENLIKHNKLDRAFQPALRI